jgi:hypothetical protein
MTYQQLSALPLPYRHRPMLVTYYRLCDFYASLLSAHAEELVEFLDVCLQPEANVKNKTFLLCH